MSSVGFPRSESAAARLMAVVVLPTPPFWFAMATIMYGEKAPSQECGHCRKVGRECQRARAGDKQVTRSHLVFAHVVRIEALEPLLEALGIPLFRGEVDGLRVVDHGVLDQNRGAGGPRSRE